MKNIYVTQPSMPEFDQYIDEIKGLWESKHLTNMGELHGKLEEQLKKYLGVKNISLISNGHMALELCIQAMELKGEIITTPFTFASTTHAIVRNGITPVFCDINNEDYTMDTEKIESLITSKTTAIIPVHVYGKICNVNKIEEIARKYKLKVIYDAAHAFGVKYENQGIGNYGDASIFSFHATKVFNTIEGGAVCFKDPKVGDKLYHLKNFGISSEEEVDDIGANAKMNEFQAAMGLCNLRVFDKEQEKRKKLVFKYNSHLEKVMGIKVQNEQEQVVYNYAYYPILVAKESGITRDVLQSELLKKNIYTRKYFYPLTSMFSCYKDKYASSKLEVALEISKSVLTLPLYADLKEEEVDYISNTIIDIVGKSR